ncbi:MAG: adenosylhomocysteinase [Anaerolineae bacterium]|nr:adenosylhomocysteinase [Anaerolineae bacterium]
MTASRIKEPSLTAGIDESQLVWQRFVTPITESYCRQIAERDYRGKKLACWQHITLNTIPMLLALQEAGVDITLGACNVDSTDDTVAAYLAAQGIAVYGWQGMSQADYQFDHYTAVMLLGLAWMFEDLPGDIQPGLQRYPAHLEREIAERSIHIHHQA